MTLEEINNLLMTTGYPVAYYHFLADDPQTAPFICYLVPYSNNFSADSKVYQKINHIQIELYTAQKDCAAESKLESVLDGAELFYDKTEVYIEGEQMYQIIYECEVI